MCRSKHDGDRRCPGHRIARAQSMIDTNSRREKAAAERAAAASQQGDARTAQREAQRASDWRARREAAEIEYRRAERERDRAIRERAEQREREKESKAKQRAQQGGRATSVAPKPRKRREDDRNVGGVALPPVSREESRATFRAEMNAATTDSDRVKALLAHLHRTATPGSSDAAWLKAAEGHTDEEILAAAAERRLPGQHRDCGCDNGSVPVYDENNVEVDRMDCLSCGGSSAA